MISSENREKKKQRVFGPEPARFIYSTGSGVVITNPGGYPLEFYHLEKKKPSIDQVYGCKFPGIDEFSSMDKYPDVSILNTPDIPPLQSDYQAGSTELDPIAIESGETPPPSPRDDDCPICMTERVNFARLISLPCGHKFCCGCISQLRDPAGYINVESDTMVLDEVGNDISAYGYASTPGYTPRMPKCPT